MGGNDRNFLTPLAALAAFVAVLIAPGFALSVGVTGNKNFPDTVSLSFVTSLGVMAIFGIVASVFGLPARAVTALLAVISIVSPFFVSASHQAPDSLPKHSPANVLIVCALASVLAWLAYNGLNIARDRMWYLAFIENLRIADSVSWSEPYFDTRHVVPRFAHNAWLLALAVWADATSLTGLGADAPYLFERIAPPLLAMLVVVSQFTLATVLCRRSTAAMGATLLHVLVLLGTRYPFFSPTSYPMFGRLAEDKSVALLIVSPVLTSLAIRWLSPGVLRSGPVLFFAATALAFTHALVFALWLIASFGLLVFLTVRNYRSHTEFGPQRASMTASIVLVALLGLAAAVPVGYAALARNEIVEHSNPRAILEQTPTHPVVRSHLRMKRTFDVPIGGPIVNPDLLREPLLLAALLGLFLATWSPRNLAAVFVLSASIPSLMLAFTPWLSARFGDLVVPWMAYRVLWNIPFGVLLGFNFGYGSDPGRAWPPSTLTRAAALITIGAVLMTTPRFPWQRFVGATNEAQSRLLPDRDPERRELYDFLRELPSGAVIATGPSFAETIRPYSGTAVLAVSDRGTVVFSRSEAEAHSRNLSNAALVSLRGRASRLRRRLAAAAGVTHLVYEHHACDRKISQDVFSNGRFVVCRFSDLPRQGKEHDRISAPTMVTANFDRDHVHAILAERGAIPDVAPGELLVRNPKANWTPAEFSKIACRPPGMKNRTGVIAWRRDSRWTANTIAIQCRIKLAEELGSSIGLRLRANLPRADETLVYHVKFKAGRRFGTVDLKNQTDHIIPILANRNERVTIRLAPAFLPYLNLEKIDLVTWTESGY